MYYARSAEKFCPGHAHFAATPRLHPMLVLDPRLVSRAPDQYKIIVWSNSYTKVVSSVQECLDKILWLRLTARLNMNAHYKRSRSDGKSEMLLMQ